MILRVLLEIALETFILSVIVNIKSLMQTELIVMFQAANYISGGVVFYLELIDLYVIKMWW